MACPINQHEHPGGIPRSLRADIAPQVDDPEGARSPFQRPLRRSRFPKDEPAQFPQAGGRMTLAGATVDFRASAEPVWIRTLSPRTQCVALNARPLWCSGPSPTCRTGRSPGPPGISSALVWSSFPKPSAEAVPAVGPPLSRRRPAGVANAESGPSILAQRRTTSAPRRAHGFAVPAANIPIVCERYSVGRNAQLLSRRQLLR